jgi:glucose dehydrogenase
LLTPFFRFYFFNAYTRILSPAVKPKIALPPATCGGLLFMGEGDGSFNAYSSSTGDLLWHDKVDAGVNAPPISYEIDGVQYVAVVAGGNAIFGFTAGDNILVYALKK